MHLRSPRNKPVPIRSHLLRGPTTVVTATSTTSMRRSAALALGRPGGDAARAETVAPVVCFEITRWTQTGLATVKRCRSSL